MRVLQLFGWKHRSAGIDAIVDYAGRVFDYQCEHPELARLTFWEGLELGTPVDERSRLERSQRKVELVLAALPTLSREQAQDLLLSILTLADGYQALPNLDRLYTGTTGADAARHAQRRDTITTTVRATLEALVRA